MNNTKIKIIPHTHWDKEWYFTAARSLVYSLKDFDEIISHLESDKKFKCFLLDGQLSIVEEYIELHPEMIENIKSLVKENRLIIGPWFTQPDSLVISGENLLKNLEIGIDLSKKYGGYQNVGYLPDSFGMSSQMPQIYKSFELKYAFFRRGTADHLVKFREFIWEGADGTQIFTHNLHHYGNMAYPPNEDQALIKYYKDIYEQLKDDTKSNIILLYNGEDQKPIRKNLPDLVKMGNDNTNFKIEISTLEDALTELHQTIPCGELDTVQGEFTFGQNSRVHKSIFSTRADLKQMNNRLENYLSNILEPLNTLGYCLGLKYEKLLIDKMWKLMLLNSAHDSIGNCNSDATNEDIKNRYTQVDKLSAELVEFKMREIGINCKQINLTQFQIYNLLPYRRSDIIRTELYSPYKNFTICDEQNNKYIYDIISSEDVTESYLKKSLKEIGVDNDLNNNWKNEISTLYKYIVEIKVDNIVGVGYKTLYLKEQQIEKNSIQDYKDKNKSFIENKYYKILFQDGCIDLHNKETDTTINNIIQVIDEGDEGDSYDYSKPSYDQKYVGNLLKGYIKEYKFRQKLKIHGKINLARNLSDRINKCMTVEQPFTLLIELTTGSKNIKVDFKTVNKAVEHRMRILFDTLNNNDYSFADIQFGTIKRKTELPQSKIWVEHNWDEKPRTIEPMLSYVTNGFEKNRVQITTESVREYQFVGEKYSSIALTIYRSTTFLGKEELNDRPGRASGTIKPTYDTRYMNEEVGATYWLTILNDEDNELSCARRAKEILTPLLSYQAAQYKNNTDNFILSEPEEKLLPTNYELFSLEEMSVLSTFRKSTRDGEIVIRRFNPRLNEAVSLTKIESKKLSFIKNINSLENEVDFKEKINYCQFVSQLYKN